MLDVDTNTIGIDNQCSACLSHDISDFVGRVTKTNRRIKEFGGETLLDVYSGIIGEMMTDLSINSRYPSPIMFQGESSGC